MEVKDSSYWDAFDDALESKAESEREQYYKELDEIEELERKEEERKLKESGKYLDYLETNRREWDENENSQSN